LEVRGIIRSELCKTMNLDSEVEMLGDGRLNLFKSEGSHQKESEVILRLMSRQSKREYL
jgi:hypothetical protein